MMALLMMRKILLLMVIGLMHEAMLMNGGLMHEVRSMIIGQTLAVNFTAIGPMCGVSFTAIILMMQKKRWLNFKRRLANNLHKVIGTAMEKSVAVFCFANFVRTPLQEKTRILKFKLRLCFGHERP